MPRINTQGTTDARQEVEDVVLNHPREVESEGGEKSSPGNSSSVSENSSENATNKSETNRRKPARTTEPR